MLNGVVMQSKLVNTPMQSVKEEEWINLREGCYRLASLSQELIRFLQNLHVQGVTVEPPCSQSIGRYINIWLPLVAELQINNSRSVMLLPPPDVAWLWYCHRLATEKYDQYVTNRFGKLVEANPPFEFQHEESNDVTSSFTRDQWALRYPDAPFFMCMKIVAKSSFVPMLMARWISISSEQRCDNVNSYGTYLRLFIKTSPS